MRLLKFIVLIFLSSLLPVLLNCSDMDEGDVSFQVIAGGTLTGYYTVDGNYIIFDNVQTDSGFEIFAVDPVEGLDDTLKIRAFREEDGGYSLEIIIYRDDEEVKSTILDPSSTSDFLSLDYELGEEDTSSDSSE